VDPQQRARLHARALDAREVAQLARDGMRSRGHHSQRQAEAVEQRIQREHATALQAMKRENRSFEA
jgi:hypothetical protein